MPFIPFGRNEEEGSCGPLPSPVSQLELTAYHEAGHAVFACLQGWRPEATIIPRWRDAVFTRGYVKINFDRKVDPILYAKWMLSGLAGEALLLGTRAFQVKKEFHEAEESLRAHMSEQDATAAMFDAWHELMDWQKPTILAVMRVAGELLDRNSIRYDAVLDIVECAHRLSGPVGLVDDQPVNRGRPERRSGRSRRTLSFVPKPSGKHERRSGEERRV